MNIKINRKTSIKYLLSLVFGLPIALKATPPLPITKNIDNQYEQFSIPVDLFTSTDGMKYCEIGLSALFDMFLHKETLSIADYNVDNLMLSVNRGLKEGYLKIVNRQVISPSFYPEMPMEEIES